MLSTIAVAMIATISGRRFRSKIRNTAADAAMKLIWIPESRPTSATITKRPARKKIATMIGAATSWMRWKAGVLSATSIRPRLTQTASR